MKNHSDRISYLKGLVDGMDLDKHNKEKILKSMIGFLNDMEETQDSPELSVEQETSFSGPKVLENFLAGTYADEDFENSESSDFPKPDDVEPLKDDFEQNLMAEQFGVFEDSSDYDVANSDIEELICKRCGKCVRVDNSSSEPAVCPNCNYFVVRPNTIKKEEIFSGLDDSFSLRNISVEEGLRKAPETRVVEKDMYQRNTTGDFSSSNFDEIKNNKASTIDFEKTDNRRSFGVENSENDFKDDAYDEFGILENVTEVKSISDGFINLYGDVNIEDVDTNEFEHVTSDISYNADYQAFEDFDYEADSYYQDEDDDEPDFPTDVIDDDDDHGLFNNIEIEHDEALKFDHSSGESHMENRFYSFDDDADYGPDYGHSNLNNLFGIKEDVSDEAVYEIKDEDDLSANFGGQINNKTMNSQANMSGYQPSYNNYSNSNMQMPNQMGYNGNTGQNPNQYNQAQYSNQPYPNYNQPMQGNQFQQNPMNNGYGMYNQGYMPNGYMPGNNPNFNMNNNQYQMFNVPPTANQYFQNQNVGYQNMAYQNPSQMASPYQNPAEMQNIQSQQYASQVSNPSLRVQPDNNFNRNFNQRDEEPTESEVDGNQKEKTIDVASFDDIEILTKSKTKDMATDEQVVDAANIDSAANEAKDDAGFNNLLDDLDEIASEMNFGSQFELDESIVDIEEIEENVDKSDNVISSNDELVNEVELDAENRQVATESVTEDILNSSFVEIAEDNLSEDVQESSSISSEDILSSVIEEKNDEQSELDTSLVQNLEVDEVEFESSPNVLENTFEDDLNEEVESLPIFENKLDETGIKFELDDNAESNDSTSSDTANANVKFDFDAPAEFSASFDGGATSNFETGENVEKTEQASGINLDGFGDSQDETNTASTLADFDMSSLTKQNDNTNSVEKENEEQAGEVKLDLDNVEFEKSNFEKAAELQQKENEGDDKVVDSFEKLLSNKNSILAKRESVAKDSSVEDAFAGLNKASGFLKNNNGKSRVDIDRVTKDMSSMFDWDSIAKNVASEDDVELNMSGSTMDIETPSKSVEDIIKFENNFANELGKADNLKSENQVEFEDVESNLVVDFSNDDETKAYSKDDNNADFGESLFSENEKSSFFGEEEEQPNKSLFDKIMNNDNGNEIPNIDYENVDYKAFDFLSYKK